MYNAIDISDNDRILIVAPHPDDETIGCGGILSLYGSQCDVLLLTDGRRGKTVGGNQTDEEIIEVRKLEFEAAMSFFGVRYYKELNICDSQLKSNEKEVFTYNLREYDYIFVPNRHERHPDHEAAYEILKKMHRLQKARAGFMEYEVWSPIISPNRFLNISEVMDKKISGLLKYESQIAELDYEVLTKGLNSYRGAPYHVPYCEAFYSDSEYQRKKKQELFAKLPLIIRKILILVKRSLKV